MLKQKLLIISVLLTLAAPGTIMTETQIEAYLARGTELFDAREDHEAEKFFKTVVQRDPENAIALYYLGRIALHDKDFDRAMELLEKSKAIEPQNAMHYHWLAHAYTDKLMNSNMLSKIGLAGDVKEHFLKAAELAPDDVEVRGCLVGFYLEAPGFLGGSKTKALEHIEEIKTRDAVEGHLQMALYYEKVEEVDAAEREYIAALEIDSQNPKPYFGIGMLQQERENYSGAFASFEKAIQIDAAYHRALYQVGRTALFSGQRIDYGLTCLHEFVKSKPPVDAPSWASAYWRMGMLYEKKNQRDLARDAYESALKMNPEHEKAREALEKLEKTD